MGSHYAPFKKLLYQCRVEGVRYFALSSTWIPIFLEDRFFKAAVDELMKNGKLKELIVVRRESLKAGEDNVHLVPAVGEGEQGYKELLKAKLKVVGERRAWDWKGELRVESLEAIRST
jgi:hypothetical protein